MSIQSHVCKTYMSTYKKSSKIIIKRTVNIKTMYLKKNVKSLLSIVLALFFSFQNILATVPFPANCVGFNTILEFFCKPHTGISVQELN